MSSIKSIVINVVTLGILLLGIMSFIIIVQSDSNLASGDRITNNTLINDSYGELQVSLDTQNDAENSLDSLEDVPPQEYVGDLNVASVVSTTRQARSVIIGTWNILIKLPMVILGVDDIIMSAITTILLILIAIGVWAIWKGAIS